MAIFIDIWQFFSGHTVPKATNQYNIGIYATNLYNIGTYATHLYNTGEQDSHCCVLPIILVPRYVTNLISKGEFELTKFF